jgi:hypothetical protein
VVRAGRLCDRARERLPVRRADSGRAGRPLHDRREPRERPAAERDARMRHRLAATPT